MRASDKAGDSFGDVLAAGLATRGGGAQVPTQTAAPAVVELTPEEQLDVLEQRIEASIGEYYTHLRMLHLRHRVEVGHLLHDINVHERWRLRGHAKFGHYVKQRWGWDRSYGYRLIDLALVHRALAPLGPAVVDTVTEAHARELAPIVRHNGGQPARNFVVDVRLELDGKRVTAAVYAVRREAAGLGRPVLSPIGDSSPAEDEIVDAELVDEDDQAEQINWEIRAAADAAEKALRQLDQALQRNVAPFHRKDAAQDLSRVRTAAFRLQRRATGLPALPGS